MMCGFISKSTYVHTHIRDIFSSPHACFTVSKQYFIEKKYVGNGKGEKLSGYSYFFLTQNKDFRVARFQAPQLSKTRTFSSWFKLDESDYVWHASVVTWNFDWSISMLDQLKCQATTLPRQIYNQMHLTSVTLRFVQFSFPLLSFLCDMIQSCVILNWIENVTIFLSKLVINFCSFFFPA